MPPGEAARAVSAPVGLRRRLGVMLTVWFFLVYGLSDHITAARTELVSVSLALDDRIPFVPEFSILYLSVSPLLYLPLLVLRDSEKLTALALAFAAQIAVAGMIYAAVPVEASTAPAGDHGIVFALIDWVNLDYNSLPSLHVALSVTAAWSVSLALDMRWRILLWVWTGLVVLSTLLTKQHTLADVAAGLCLAAATAWLLVPASERLISGVRRQAIR
jgi:membrane-associated phospholipid phosphatase